MQTLEKSKYSLEPPLILMKQREMQYFDPEPPYISMLATWDTISIANHGISTHPNTDINKLDSSYQ